MTKPSDFESMEHVDGWQDWPADDSNLAPMVFTPIRRRAEPTTVRLSIVASVNAGGRPASTEEVVVNATIDENAIRNPAAALQQFALTAVAAALIALVTAVNAGAQEAPGTEPTPPGHIIEAPIGHRQPHEWQLPRKVQRDEGHRTEQQIEFDKKLQIRRGCE